MEDKELIELAAKATGAKYYADRDWPGLCLSGEPDILPFYVNSRGSGAIEWNPLTDDGDALRLAVTLGIDVSHDEIGMKSFVYVRATFNDELHVGLSEVFDDENKRLERTRRAITRAAAQIGKEME